MSVPDTIIFSENVVSGGRTGPAAVAVRDGIIQAVHRGSDRRAEATIDIGRLALLPGLVDTHVHVNEPGRTEWEGFATASRAAAAGGITTMVVMPLNCDPVVTNVAALEKEAAAAARSCIVDYGFWGGLVPGNTSELHPLHRAGVLGFKAFMVHSGIDEFPNAAESDLRRAIPILRDLGVPLLVHAEDPAVIAAAEAVADLCLDPRSYRRYLASRPPEAERAAIALMIQLCREHRSRIHIVHLAAAEPIADLRAARLSGLPITVETCPHYLTFAAEDIADGATVFKCAPPIREAGHRESLWSALGVGDIDLVATDHSPCPPAMKLSESGDFLRSWGGVSSLQLSLCAVWTEANRRGFSLADVVRWMSEAPASLAGLSAVKGRIAPGCNADLVAFDPDAAFAVRGAELEHRHKLTPYDGRTLAGSVEWTMLRGRVIYRRGSGFEMETPGRWLSRATLPPPPQPSPS